MFGMPPHRAWCQITSVNVNENRTFIEFEAKLSDPEGDNIIPSGSYIGRVCGGDFLLNETVSVIL